DVLLLSARLRAALAGLGLCSAGPACPIIPVLVGDAHDAVRLSAKLEERGLLVPAVRPPSVPEGTARLRISLTAGHTEEDIDHLTRELMRCGSGAASARRCGKPDGDV